MPPIVLRTLTLDRADAVRLVDAIRIARANTSGAEAAAWSLLLAKAIAVLDRIAAAEARQAR